MLLEDIHLGLETSDSRVANHQKACHIFGTGPAELHSQLSCGAPSAKAPRPVSPACHRPPGPSSTPPAAGHLSPWAARQAHHQRPTSWQQQQQHLPLCCWQQNQAAAAQLSLTCCQQLLPQGSLMPLPWQHRCYWQCYLYVHLLLPMCCRGPLLPQPVLLLHHQLMRRPQRRRGRGEAGPTCCSVAGCLGGGC